MGILESIGWIFLVAILIAFGIRVILVMISVIWELAPAIVMLMVVFLYYYSTGQLDALELDLFNENSVETVKITSQLGKLPEQWSND